MLYFRAVAKHYHPRLNQRLTLLNPLIQTLADPYPLFRPSSPTALADLLCRRDTPRPSRIDLYANPFARHPRRPYEPARRTRHPNNHR
jgi:hypothetical protein